MKPIDRSMSMSKPLYEGLLLQNDVCTKDLVSWHID